MAKRLSIIAPRDEYLHISRTAQAIEGTKYYQGSYPKHDCGYVRIEPQTFEDLEKLEALCRRILPEGCWDTYVSKATYVSYGQRISWRVQRIRIRIRYK